MSFSNEGTINVSNGDTLDISSTSWSNTGSIDVSGGTLNLGSTFTTAQLGTLNHTGGIVNVTGMLNNAGATLNVGTDTALGTLTLVSSGTIENGTIADAGSGLAFTGGTLSGVTYDGTMNLSSSSSSVIIANGLTMASVGGTGAGAINLTGQSSVLYAEGTETLNNATVDAGNNSTDYIYNYDPSAAAVLTLGPSLVIDQTGNNVQLTGYEDRSGSGIVNAGTIDAEFNGGTFTIGDVSFSNEGTINVSNGDTVTISGTFSNLSAGTLTGGVYVISGGSTLTLPENETISILAADVTLSGIGSALRSFQTAGSDYTGLDTTLASITSAGVFGLLGDLSANEAQAVSDAGVLQLGGGNFASPGLTITSTGSVTGFGTVSAPVANSGVIEAQGGLLRVTGAVSATGVDNIAAGASLEFDAATSSGQTATFTANTGNLLVGLPSSFAAVISGFATGNAIDLIDTIATAASYQSGTLQILDGETTVASLNLSGSYTSADFEVATDGNGGTLVTIGSPPVITGDFWQSGVSGDWGTVGNWNPNGAPNATTAVATITVPGTYTVTIANSESFTIGTLTLNDPLATLNIAGTLTIANTLVLDAGTVAVSGTINGGVIETFGGSFSGNGGTLSGVTYDGTMNLSASSSYVYVTNGLTMAGVGGTGTGTIDLTGQSAQLYAEGSETLNNATINIGNNSTDYIYNYDYSAAAVLTLGPSLVIDQTGNNVQLTGYEDRSGSGIVNEGMINADFSGGTFTIGDVSFTNAGTINVSNGDTVDINSTSWSNSGSIDVSGGTLNLGSSFTLAQLGTLNHTGGIVNVTGTLNDAGATLNVGTSTALGTLTLVSGGTIENGTIADPGSGLAFTGGTLSGVTYDGTMNLSASSSYVYVTNGLTMAGVGGTGTGTIDLTGQSAQLYAEGSETLNNATINIGNNSTDYIYNYDYSAAAVLTFGPTLTIDQTGSNANLSGYYDRSGSGIVNEGMINADFSGGTFTIGDVSFTNAGTINVSNGDTVDINSTSWSNSGSIDVSGGTLNLGSSFTLAQLGTLNHTGGIVNVTGTLNDAGATLNVGTSTALGTLTLVSGGTIENGTIADPGSGLAFTGGTLSGVTYDGTMNLSASSSYVYVTNGLTMAGVGGTGTGTIDLTGQSAQLYAEGSETLNNATINIGNNSTDYIYNYDYSAAAVLTFGPTLTIDQTGSNANLSGYYDRSGSGIVNEGMINADFSGGTFTIGDVSFTNAGTINVSNGDTVDINSTSWSNSGSIDVSGGTLNLGSSFTLAQLGTLNHTGGIVNVTGTLNDAGATLNVGTSTALGTLTLVSGGTIENGTIADPGSGLAFTGGTLSGVTYDGTMNLSASSSYVYVTNGLTMAGVGGTGTGTIDLTGQSAQLYAEGSETLNNATINIGNNSTDYIYNYDYSAAAVLTLGPSLVIDQTGNNVQLTGYEDRSGSGIVNEGMINADFSGGTFTIGDVSFTNAGTINVSNGDTVDINSTSWSNSGSIDVSGGTLNLGSSFTLAQLGTLNHTGGIVNVTGTLNDAGATLNVGTSTALGTLTLVSGGTIENGTIADPGSGLAFTGGTLSGMTYDGTMNLSASSSYVYVTNGLTMAGVGGTGTGTIDLTGQSAQLYAEGSETLNNATINIGNSSYDYLYNDDPAGAATLTLAGNLTIDHVGTYVILDTSAYGRSTSEIINDGTINADLSGGSFTIQGAGSFDNQGTVNVSNGDTLYVMSPETGAGSYTIGAGSILEFTNSVASGTTVYFGASTGTLMLEQPSSFDGAISASSGSLASNDFIYLEGFNATYTTATPTFNSSTDTTTLLVTDPHDGLSVSLTLDGNYSADTFTASSASGGADIADPPATGTIVNGGSLDISTSSNETVTFTGATGSLMISQPESFTGQIIGFTGTAPNPAHSDTIDLVAINYDSPHFSEAYNASTGLLTLSDGTNSASLTFVNFDGTLNFASDGNGGTLITDPPKTSPSGNSLLTADAAPRSVELAHGPDQFDFDSGWTAGQSNGLSAADGQQNSSENQSAFVSIGGPGDDQFVFHPGIGADTIVNFNPQKDILELDHFANVQTMQQLASLITSDAHGDAMIELGHNDSITVPGLTQTYLQAHLESLVRLHS